MSKPSASDQAKLIDMPIFETLTADESDWLCKLNEWEKYNTAMKAKGLADFISIYLYTINYFFKFTPSEIIAWIQSHSES